ncbi:SDR family oxidoreductase [Tsukamurella ocularis]|uniref:SDR family oxidoreductase n=1 Tax=Tsukamurella ocularis TaxID=1970234 RepID=UPI0039F07C18
MTDLTGKTALVTGASSGIGTGIARALASAGVNVGLAARRADRLESLKAELDQTGATALVLPTDVTDVTSVRDSAHRLQAQFGRIDILINNAGIMPISPLDAFKTDEWDQMVDVNLKGVLNGVAAVLPTMIEQRSGHIVNVSSIAGRRIFGAGFAVYSATKYAVSAFSEGLRQEVGAAHNVRVTTLEPGAADTELLGTTSDPALQDAVRASAAEQQLITPADLAETVLFALRAPAHVNVADLFVLPTSQV